MKVIKEPVIVWLGIICSLDTIVFVADNTNDFRLADDVEINIYKYIQE